jgi:hypothetical protein
MPIQFQDLPVIVISPVRDKTNKRGETHQAIVAPVCSPRDHWYANVYPVQHEDFEDAVDLFEAQTGDQLVISGSIRKYQLGEAFGVVIDVETAWSDDEND